LDLGGSVCVLCQLMQRTLVMLRWLIVRLNKNTETRSQSAYYCITSRHFDNPSVLLSITLVASMKKILRTGKNYMQMCFA